MDQAKAASRRSRPRTISPAVLLLMASAGLLLGALQLALYDLVVHQAQGSWCIVSGVTLLSPHLDQFACYGRPEARLFFHTDTGFLARSYVRFPPMICADVLIFLAVRRGGGLVGGLGAVLVLASSVAALGSFLIWPGVPDWIHVGTVTMNSGDIGVVVGISCLVVAICRSVVRERRARLAPAAG